MTSRHHKTHAEIPCHDPPAALLELSAALDAQAFQINRVGCCTLQAPEGRTLDNFRHIIDTQQVALARAAHQMGLAATVLDSIADHLARQAVGGAA